MRGATLNFPKGKTMFDEFDFSALITGSGPGSECSVVIIEPGAASGLQEQFHVLRFRSFGKWEGTDPRIGKEYDRYDSFSTSILVVWEGIVIAGCRLIDGERINITLDPALVDCGRHFEISRMLIRSEVKDRATRDRVMFTLCQWVAQYAFKTRGYDDLYSDTRLPFYVALNRIFGESLERIGEQHDVKKNGEVLALVPTRVRRTSAPVMQKRFMRRLQPQEAALESV